MTILLVSDIVPVNSVGGHLALYRHFARDDAPTMYVATDGVVSGFASTRLRHRAFSRILRKVSIWPCASALRNIADEHAISYDELSALTRSIEPTLLLTVAHGRLCHSAHRLSREFKLPMATIFHDWWPDISGLEGSRRIKADRDFNKLIEGSTVALSVGPGMTEHLHSHPRVVQLPPMPPETRRRSRFLARLESQPIRLRYIGNLGEYGEMIADALTALNARDGIQFEVRGASPRWPVSLQKTFRSKGLWDGFLERSRMLEWLAEADILLVAMSFSVQSRRQVETSFPSKIVEYTHLNKPIIIWGPDYCSAARWARETGAAICVTSPSAEDLAKILLGLNSQDYEDLANKSSAAAETQFNPDQIQRIFLDALEPFTVCSGMSVTSQANR